MVQNDLQQQIHFPKPELLIQVTCSRNTKLKLLVEVEEEENGFKLCEFDMKPMGRIRPGCHGLHLVNAPRQKNVGFKGMETKGYPKRYKQRT